jgi:putative two-component system response regulator
MRNDMEIKPVILIVDDQPQNIELIEAHLVNENYDIVTAVNGKDALKKLSENVIDMILLDVMMPEMDGFEVTRNIRQDEKYRLLPIILVTALHETENRVRGIEAGCDDFISKPFEKTLLLARIRSLLKVKNYNDLIEKYRIELESKVAEKTNELTDTYTKIKHASLETIQKLSRTSEHRDEYTGAHIKRMSRYSEAVARRIGLDEATVDDILYGSSMHDLGKIGIPDSILMKDSKLNPEEWEIMKTHSAIGAAMLEGSDSAVINMGRSIAQNHHEKWDGSGYPASLKGTEIPIAGRIAAIADVFDALTSIRPYKKPFSLEKAFQIIRDGKGNHFDPDVVDAFFDVQDEIIDIKSKFSRSDYTD